MASTAHYACNQLGTLNNLLFGFAFILGPLPTYVAFIAHALLPRTHTRAGPAGVPRLLLLDYLPTCLPYQHTGKMVCTHREEPALLCTLLHFTLCHSPRVRRRVRGETLSLRGGMDRISFALRITLSIGWRNWINSLYERPSTLCRRGSILWRQPGGARRPTYVTWKRHGHFFSVPGQDINSFLRAASTLVPLFSCPFSGTRT